MKLLPSKLLILSLLITATTFSQQKVSERDVIGKWSFHLDLNKELEDDVDDDAISNAIAKGFLTTINELVKKVDIKFHFKRNKTLVVTQISQIDDEPKKEVKYYRWKIENGLLKTRGIDKEKYSTNNNSWMMSKGNLVSVNKNLEIQKSVYMKRVK